MINRQKPKSLASSVVERLLGEIRTGRYPAGKQLPTESTLMGEFGVSRTVVREAISQLQACGAVETRHGVGTFVVGAGQTAFRVSRSQLKTLKDVVQLLELRIGLEVEAASLAAQRRSHANLQRMKKALTDFDQAVRDGGDSVHADFAFHYEIACATQNDYFSNMMGALGVTSIPRARLPDQPALSRETLRYLAQVDAEHKKIFDAIVAQDPSRAARAMRQHLTRGLERRRVAAAAVGRPGG